MPRVTVLLSLLFKLIDSIYTKSILRLVMIEPPGDVEILALTSVSIGCLEVFPCLWRLCECVWVDPQLVGGPQLEAGLCLGILRPDGKGERLEGIGPSGGSIEIG